MVKNKHDLGINHGKLPKSRTKVLGIIGRRGPLNTKEIKSDPNLGGRYVEILLKALAPKNDDKVLDKRLFCWQDLVNNPTKTENKFADKIKKHLGRASFTVSSYLKEKVNDKIDEKCHAQLQISQEENWVKFQIDYDIRDGEKGKCVFYDNTFRVTESLNGKESPINGEFSLNKKSGKLYVYSTAHTSPYLGTYVNKSLDKSKTKQINRILEEKVLNYLMKKHEIVEKNISMITDYISVHEKRRLLEKFGPNGSTVIEAILKSACRPENVSEAFHHTFESIVKNAYSHELENLMQKQSYCLYSLNVRGLMEYCITESESKINKIIINICNDSLYQSRTSIKDHQITSMSGKLEDLDFPFLLYHSEIMKVLPANFVADELKQIATELEGLIDNVPLHELKFLVTYHYYKDFEYFMNIKPIILGKKSHIEEIKSDDINLYKLIMDYQITLLNHIELIQERNLKDIIGTRKSFEEQNKRTTVSSKLCRRQKILSL